MERKTMMNNLPMSCHIFAMIRDESDNRMNIAARIEFCLNDECVAVYEGRWYDYHYWVKGASFHVFTARKLLAIAGARFNYTRHEQLPDQVDRFDIGTYDFCEMLRKIRLVSKSVIDPWEVTSIDKELEYWLDQEELPFDPVVLQTFGSTSAERIIY